LPNDHILEILTDAVLAGAQCVLSVRSTGQIGAVYKDRTELVTEADKQSDAAILAIFRERFPKVDSSISFHLEESGVSGVQRSHRVGADPLDGTSHFASGGTFYSVQAHYIEDGVPLVGVVFQPEVFVPLSETPNCMGRFSSAIRGGGAFVSRSEFTGSGFILGARRKIVARPAPETRAYVCCVPVTGKMNDSEKARARRVHESGLVGAATGVGCAGGNVMMVLFGGQDVYANFGSGDDLDLVPPQVIAEEAGLTVWGPNRRSPVWHVRKQPFIVAPSPRIAEMFLTAAGALA
jgi:3'-phosphoadenosine 5'-phosphosulfate (PAPS) 3'-phosphatase